MKVSQNVGRNALRQESGGGQKGVKAMGARKTIRGGHRSGRELEKAARRLKGESLQEWTHDISFVLFVARDGRASVRMKEVMKKKKRETCVCLSRGLKKGRGLKFKKGKQKRQCLKKNRQIGRGSPEQGLRKG